MHRTLILALCAAVSAGAAPVGAVAQDAPPVTGPAAGKPKAAAMPVKRKNAARATTPAAPQEPYQLVPAGEPTSAQARARRNAFGTPDADPEPSGGGSRRVGIGFGGANGTTPGMQMGF